MISHIARPRGRALATAALPAVIGVILVLTLTPTPSTAPAGPPLEGCWVCGARGLADVIANVLLFTPLGVALFLRSRRVGWSVLFGALLSAAIELTQYHVPGRDPSLGDLVFDTLGTGAGALLAHSWPLWRAPARRWVAPSVAAAAALGVMAGGILLLEPASLPGPLLPISSPAPAYLYPYTGQVLSAGAGNLTRAPGRVDDTDALRARLRAGVHVTAIAGPPPPGLSPLFMLLDSGGGEVLLLGLDRSELVFRYRTRAATLRLDSPDLRLAVPAAALRPGARFNASASRAERGYCLHFNRTTDCSLGFTLGDTWSVLFYPGSLSPVQKRLLELLWVAALFVPAGFWLRRSVDAPVIVAPSMLLLVALPRLLHCAPTPPGQVAAAVGGVLFGMACSRWIPGGGATSGAPPGPRQGEVADHLQGNRMETTG